MNKPFGKILKMIAFLMTHPIPLRERGLAGIIFKIFLFASNKLKAL